MISVSVEDFFSKYPKFRDCFEPDEVQCEIDLAQCFVDECAFGDAAERALFLVVAHELQIENSMRESGGSGQMVTTEKVGDIQKSYQLGAAEDSDSSFRQTRYGQKFLQLRSSVVSAFVID